jgi:hypothetical protein
MPISKTMKKQKITIPQIERVYNLMIDGRKRTLAEISVAVGGPEASISARIRELRRAGNGGYDVRSEYFSKGCWVYWIHKETKQ